MKAIVATLFSIILFAGCAQTQNNAKIFEGSKKRPSANEAVATFAEGCFWHTEIVFQSLVGVRDALSGYAGGTDAHPDYEKVSTGETGHAESVQVYYDPSVISYQTLVAAFFASQDPTQLNRQGNDEGTQYRSIILYHDEKQKAIAEKSKLAAQRHFPHPIVTEIVPLTKFYKAEDYHQQYFDNNANAPYCQVVIAPKLEKLEKKKVIKPFPQAP